MRPYNDDLQYSYICLNLTIHVGMYIIQCYPQRMRLQ